MLFTPRRVVTRATDTCMSIERSLTTCAMRKVTHLLLTTPRWYRCLRRFRLLFSPHSVSVPSAHFSSSFPCLPPCPPATPDFGPAVFFLAGHVGGKSGTALHKYFSEGTAGPGGFYPLPNFLPRGLPPAPPIGGDVTLPLSPNWSGHCPMIMKYP